MGGSRKKGGGKGKGKGDSQGEGGGYYQRQKSNAGKGQSAAATEDSAGGDTAVPPKSAPEVVAPQVVAPKAESPAKAESSQDAAAPPEGEASVDAPKSEDTSFASAPSEAAVTEVAKPAEEAPGTPVAKKADEAPGDSASSTADAKAAASSNSPVPACTGEAPAPDDVAEEESAQDAFAGQYVWRSDDGKSEHVIRLQAGGNWWHAAHRTGEMRQRKTPASGEKVAEDADNAAVETVAIWEIAESLGTWQIEEAPSTPEGPTQLSLNCTNTRWSSDHPVAPLILRPTPDGRRDIDQMIEDGQLKLVYCARRSAETGGTVLELVSGSGTGAAPDSSKSQGSTHASMRAVQVAVQTLGFVRTYESKR